MNGNFLASVNSCEITQFLRQIENVRFIFWEQGRRLFGEN